MIKAQAPILIFALVFVVSDLSKTVNAVLSTVITEELNLSDSAISLATSAFYISFVIFQLPLGIMLDKYGSKKVQVSLIPVALLGALICFTAEGFASFFFGRLLLGIGLSVALMSAFKAVKQWCPDDKVPTYNGLVLGIGALGGVLATWPAEYVSELYGWRTIYLIVSGLVLFSWLCMVFGVPTQPQSSEKTPKINITQALSNPVLWKIGIPSALSIGLASAMQSLWAGMWLANLNESAEKRVGLVLLVMSLTTILGSVLLGKAATVAKKYLSMSIDLVTVIFISIAVINQLVIVIVQSHSMILWGMLALLGTSGMLTFSSIAEKTPFDCLSTTNSIFNIMTFAAAIAAQVGFGLLVQYSSFVSIHDLSVKYQFAFLVLIGAQALSVIYYFLRDK